MVAAEQFAQLNHIVVALPHFTAVNGDHIIVQPVTCGHFMIANSTLCNLAFVVRKLQIHSAAMDIKFFAQVFGAHGRTFNMPSRKTIAPGALPAHDMFRRRIFPKGKIAFIFFLILAV